ncbi:hypothetical protein Droror1_Dr00007154 [Drosera rotundifolia]
MKVIDLRCKCIHRPSTMKRHVVPKQRSFWTITSYKLCHCWIMFCGIFRKGIRHWCNLFSSSTRLAAGACGYGPLALRFNGGYLAAGDASLFKNGAGCGTCLQVRCKESLLCTTVGTKVILTDRNISNNTGLVLSRRAFASMAKEGMEQSLFTFGIVDLEYKRIPCNYKHRNLTLMVRDFSIFPNYLAIKVLYQGGQTEILGIDVAQVGAYNWVYLTRNYGVVWDTSSTPPGPLQFRFTVTDGYDGSFVLAKNALPADWNHPGVLYDTGVQITSIAQESCAHCDNGWNKPPTPYLRETKHI